MKHLFLLMLSLMASLGLMAQTPELYVWGNGDDDPTGVWCGGVDMKIIESNKLVNNTITYANIPAGFYHFGLVDADWGNRKGFEEMDAAHSTPNYVRYEGNSASVGFYIDSPSTITISYVRGMIRLQSTTPIEKEIKTYSLILSPALVNKPETVSEVIVPMSLESGTYTYKSEHVSLKANREYTYSVCGNGDSSYYLYPEQDSKLFTLDRTGIYTLTFSFDPTLPDDDPNKLKLDAILEEVAETPFCVIGNGYISAEGNWLNGVDFEYNEKNYLKNNTITFDQVPAGNWRFIVTNADENPKYGLNEVDATLSTPGYYGIGLPGKNSIIKFDLDSVSQVTISLQNNKVVLTSTRPFLVKEDPLRVVGNAEDDPTEAWLYGDDLVKDPRNILQDSTVTYPNVPAGDWYFAIINEDETKIWESVEDVNTLLSTVECSTVTQRELSWIGFQLTQKSDVTISIKNNKVVVEATPVATTGVEEVQVLPTVYAQNGTIYASVPNFEIYNLVGQNVSAYNGQLLGVYIVRLGEQTVKVNVK